MPDKTTSLAEIGEDALVEELTAGLELGRDVVAGAGDDCAVIRGADRDTYTLLKADCVVEGVHYRADTPPAAVGHKAMARALSDIAAMAGRPRHALVTLILQPDRALSYARGLYRGIEKAARRHGLSVVGGETARPAPGGGASISVALTGTVARDRCCLRSGGRPGDALFVTGRLGGSLAGRHLRFEPRLAEAGWLAEHFKPRAMMDLSDGLARDLPRLAAASGCGYRIDPELVPRSRGADIAAALGDGEDYELLFAVSPRRAKALGAAWAKRFKTPPLSQVGSLAESGTEQPRLEGGWAHF